jgi:hypothetical protein
VSTSALPTTATHAPPSRLVHAGLLTALSDGLFASAQALIGGTGVARLWQGVASTLLGRAALDGGATTAAIGLLMHVGVAFGWSTVFYLLYERWPALRRAAASPLGVAKVAAVWGPSIWLVMSLVVIPLLVRRPPAIGPRWWVQLVGHAIFVAMPMVWAIARPRRADG